MNRRVRVSGLHLIFSCCIAILAAMLVFLLWYPPPYATLAGGTSLFAILISIDVVLGPLLTAFVANPHKSLSELRRDIGIIVLVQLVAIGYGLYIIALARPVHMVFEVDRFTVVNASDINTSELVKAPEAYRKLPWTGPTLIAARKSLSQNEMLRSLELGIQGVDISMQPDRWVGYTEGREQVIAAVRPIETLIDKYPETLVDLQHLAAKHGISMDDMRYLPLTSRRIVWTALVALPDARIVGYLPVDGFL